jgi:hypothetical protein
LLGPAFETRTQHGDVEAVSREATEDLVDVDLGSTHLGVPKVSLIEDEDAAA